MLYAWLDRGPINKEKAAHMASKLFTLHLRLHRQRRIGAVSQPANPITFFSQDVPWRSSWRLPGCHAVGK